MQYVRNLAWGKWIHLVPWAVFISSSDLSQMFGFPQKDNCDCYEPPGNYDSFLKQGEGHCYIHRVWPFLAFFKIQKVLAALPKKSTLDLNCPSFIWLPMVIMRFYLHLLYFALENCFVFICIFRIEIRLSVSEYIALIHSTILSLLS